MSFLSFRTYIFSSLIFCITAPLMAQQGLPIATHITTLRPNHPRLFLTDDDLPTIRKAISEDPYAQNEFKRLRKRADALLTKPTDTYRITGSEHTLLETARDVENRVITLSGIYRLTRDRRYADRATAEMLSAASYPDWYPHHFLDTAELTTALGIGYDWLYPILTSHQRQVIRTAIQERGITPFLKRLNKNDVHYDNNWGQVCYGGETVGALAIAETNNGDSIRQTQRIIGQARTDVGLLMKLFAPDGGFEEGPVYWNYATTYNILYLAALDSAIGTDFGQSNAPGFNFTAMYRIQSLGPIEQYANFGDAAPAAFPAPQMFWFGGRFNCPEYVEHEKLLSENVQAKMSAPTRRESMRFDMLGLIWYALAPKPDGTKRLPLVQNFSRVSQVYMRSSWGQQAWFVGFKGGSATASHGHLDLGSFVLDGLGQRWAVDLGADNYGLPGYFGKQRWDYYRLQTQAHNTLTVDGPNEDPDATASVVAASAQNNTEMSIVNLDNAYKAKLRRWKRGMKIIGDKGVLIQDEITPKQTVDVTWNFHTRAQITLTNNGRRATLRQGQKTLQMTILFPVGAHFEATNDTSLSPNSPNPDVHDLIIRDRHIDSPQTIAVFAGNYDRSLVKIAPLAKWN